MKTIQISYYLFLIIGMLFLAVFDAEAQSPVKTVFQMHTEVNNYVNDKAKELTS